MKLHALHCDLILENSDSVQVIPWSEYTDDDLYDPWDAAEQAEEVARVSGIRISRNKELSLMALNSSGDVVGAVWSSYENDDDQEAMVYDFDVAVLPQYRKHESMIGIKLIDSALEDFNNLRAENPRSYVRVWVVNPRLARVLERMYGFEPENTHGDGSTHMTYYG